MKIYLSRPMAGRGFAEVDEWYTREVNFCRGLGLDVFHPWLSEEELGPDKRFVATGHDHASAPTATTNAIVGRDRWMATNVDLLLTDLTEAQTVSIGCMMELAWAYDHGAHTIVVMKDKSVHRHAFVTGAAHVIYPDLQGAKHYLSEFCKSLGGKK